MGLERRVVLGVVVVASARVHEDVDLAALGVGGPVGVGELEGEE